MTRRTLSTLVFAALALLLGAGPAAAHNVLVGSDPAKGSTVDTAPQQVRLTFDQPVQGGVEGANTITLTGPDGNRWQVGEVQVEGSSVTAPVGPLGPAGEYTIGYRILSADGHPVSGTVTFTLTTPGTGSPLPAQDEATGTEQAASDGGDQSGGGSVWLWIGGAVVLLGAGLAIALRLGRSTD
ncbi:MAG TPA: copper resistance CopC family protein [Pseudonocardiaceae bacterium]